MGCVAIEQPDGSFTWHQGLLLYKEKFIVLDISSLQNKLLHEVHDTEWEVILASYVR